MMVDMTHGATDAKPREWGARLLKWCQTGVEKVPEKDRSTAIKYVYQYWTRTLYETRRDKQNRLDWAWNREISKYTDDTTADEAHGMSKLELLAPLYLQWGVDNPVLMELGTDFADMVSYLPTYEHRCKYAYHMLRSNDITVKQFAEYLTIKQRYWAEQGVPLNSSDDLYYEAMGLKR